jgi:hypothetical protein
MRICLHIGALYLVEEGFLARLQLSEVQDDAQAQLVQSLYLVFQLQF